MKKLFFEKFFKSKAFRLILIFSALSLFVFLLSKLFASCPDFVEKYYSRGFYRFFSQGFSYIFRWTPFSSAEILIIGAICFSIGYLFYCIYKTIRSFIKKEKSFKPLISFVVYAVCTASILYSCFYIFWGFNFSRKSLADNLGYETTEYSVEELAELCRDLAAEINRLRPLTSENEDGIMCVLDDNLAERAITGYTNLSAEYSFMGGNYGKPKFLLTSTGFCYMNITGIFIPYTYEANVNHRTRDCSIPSTILHEMAHQRGFSREDEANFIAFMACRAHDDIDYQYSGYYLAFIHSTNALKRYDSELASEILSTLCDGFWRDVSDSNSFWKQFEGPVEEVVTSVNDSYLQANGQEDGVHSYGRMVDLLLAEKHIKDLNP